MTLTVGSLGTGYGGLDLATPGSTLWMSEIDPAACTVLKQRFPDVPNLGDLTAVESPPPVDLLLAGFPCQPVSHAGKRQGVEDERWLWDDIEAFVCRMEPRPGYVFLENVAGLLSANRGRAIARVLHGLAALGFDAEWGTVRAADVGAPHRRDRWFCLAHTNSTRPQGHRPERSYWQRGDDVNGLGVEFDPAIRRWEQLTRPAPAATVLGSEYPGLLNHGWRLNPQFVEWMMGLPAGWVTDCGVGYTAQLRVLGNGVVPQQAAVAFDALLDRAFPEPEECPR